MIGKLAPEASCLKEASRGEMKNSGYVCRSLCGILSDAGSTPAASTSYVFIFLDDLETLAIDASSSFFVLV